LPAQQPLTLLGEQVRELGGIAAQQHRVAPRTLVACVGDALLEFVRVAWVVADHDGGVTSVTDRLD